MQVIIDIQQILRQAQQSALRSINTTMVQAHWLVGKRIVEEEQLGESRAEYGKMLLKNLSAELQKEFGSGFSKRNLEQMRLFYQEYPIAQTVSAQLETAISETVSRKLQTPDFQLSWSHYLVLGKGFTFVARQKRITFDEKHYHIDLVFYNRLLRSFVLIDLKIGELTYSSASVALPLRADADAMVIAPAYRQRQVCNAFGISSLPPAVLSLTTLPFA